MPIPTDLETQLTLDDCLSEFTKKEVLEKSNWWNCDTCKKKQPTEKQIQIWKLPPLLTIVLKRFSFNENTKTREKIRSVVEFPLRNLDVYSHVDSP